MNALQREASAYHESGHVIVARRFGWWLNPDGVEIDVRQYTGLRARKFDYTEYARVIVDQAGWLAECRFHGLAGPRTEDDVREVIELFEYDDDEGGDVHSAVAAIREHNPGIADDALIARYMEFQKDTVALLNEVAIWADVVRVAKALLERGKLSEEQVDDLVSSISD